LSGTEDYVAIDLGATSGRAIIGRFDGERIGLEEITRFPNEPVARAGRLHWDISAVFAHVEEALAKAAGHSRHVVSVGCDSWGQDHAFLDADNRLLEWPFSYQDPRTAGTQQDIDRVLSPLVLQRRTAGFHVPISTLHQLIATRRDRPDLLERAAALLFIPDLVNHELTGETATEPCIASLSQLLGRTTMDWDGELIEKFGFPPAIFPRVLESGTRLGTIRTCFGGSGPWDVHLTGSHDTASAFAATPLDAPGDLVICAGTWLMLGMEVPEPVVNEETLRLGMGAIRLPGGLWAQAQGIYGFHYLERYRREEKAPGPAELTRMARDAAPFAALFDPGRLDLRPGDSFLTALERFCQRTGQQTPASPGAVTRCILESLALYVAGTVREMGAALNRPVNRIILVGGGSRNDLLNQMVADATRTPVEAGLTEATAAGNALVQAMGRGRLASVADMRRVTRRSFPWRTYAPADVEAWEQAGARLATV